MKNVIITILAVLVLILGGYLVYDKFIVAEENKEIVESNDDKEVIDVDNETEKEEIASSQVLEFLPDSIAVLNNGDVYVNVYGSTLDIEYLFGDDLFQTLSTTRNNYKQYNFNNMVVLNSSNEYFKGMKLDISDVKAIYSYIYGQDLNSNCGIFMIKNDNTVYGISLYSLINGKTSVTLISSLNNIVKIESENVPKSGMFTYAIDSNGNKYNMNDYVPSDYKVW